MATEDIIIRGKANMKHIDRALAITGQGLTEFQKRLSKNFMVLQKTGRVVDQFTGKQVKMGQAMRVTSLQARRFKFEYLSIMFAGMALDRAFGGLMRTQMQLFGVTEMMSSAWTLVLLPVMEAITPLIFMLIEAFMNMPEGMKLAIGAGVLFMAILGKVMLVGGQIMLFLGGLKILAPGVFALMKGGAVAFFAALGPILLIIAAIVIVIVGIWLAWKTNFMNIRKNITAFVAAFKQWFGGIISIVKGALNIIKGIFTGDFELVKKGIVQIFKGLWNYVIGGWKMVGQAIVIIFKGVAKLIWNIIKVVVDAVLWVADKVAGVFGKSVKYRMPKFQSGGLVTETGPAILHSGERVVPKGRGSRGGEMVFSPTINLSATVNNEMDIKVLAEKLNGYWANDFERLMQRGSY